MAEDGKPMDCLEAAADARNQANVYSFMATLLNERPDEGFVGNLKAAGGDFIRGLAEEASLTAGIADGFRDMAKYVEDKRCASEPEIRQDLAVDWTRLFRGVSPAYSPMPPYEASFMGDGSNDLELILGVNQLYRDNGLLISNDYNDRPDYLGLEFSFLQYLAEAEAQAWEHGDADLARAQHERARTFLRQHLGAWVHLFVAPAMRFARTGFYHGFLQLCQGVVADATA